MKTREIGARLLLADELGEPLRPQRGLGGVLLARLAGDEAARRLVRAAPAAPICAAPSLGKLLEAEADQPRAPRRPHPLRARAAAIAADACGWPIAEIDERRHRVEHRLRRAPLVDRAGEPRQPRIDGGEGRRLVLELGDDAFGDLRPDTRGCG